MSVSETNAEAYARADELENSGAYEEAFKLFKRLAEAGEADAMNRLAVMYEAARGVPFDLEQSIAWDMRAIEAGSHLSRLNLGITHRRHGNIREARRWFEDALAHGDGEAALELAKLYSVSELERGRVLNYLETALRSGSLCPDSVAEAEALKLEIG